MPLREALRLAIANGSAASRQGGQGEPGLSHASRQAGCSRYRRCHRTDAPTSRLAPRRAPITWPRPAAVRIPDSGSGCGLRNTHGDSPARRCLRAQRERCGRAPAGSVSRSAARCADRHNCSSRRRGTTPRAAPVPECTGIDAPGGAAARCPQTGRLPLAAAANGHRAAPPLPASLAKERCDHDPPLSARSGMLWSAGGVGPVASVRWRGYPRSAADFAAECGRCRAPVAAGLALTGVLPPQVLRTAERARAALPNPRASSSAPTVARADFCAGSAAIAERIVPCPASAGLRVAVRTALPAPGCCHRRSCPPASAALRVALARPASLAKSPRPPALPAPAPSAPSAPASGPRLPPGAYSPRPRGGRPGS